MSDIMLTTLFYDIALLCNISFVAIMSLFVNVSVPGDDVDSILGFCWFVVKKVFFLFFVIEKFWTNMQFYVEIVLMCSFWFEICDMNGNLIKIYFDILYYSRNVLKFFIGILRYLRLYRSKFYEIIACLMSY